jgi:hypothetical protein
MKQFLRRFFGLIFIGLTLLNFVNAQIVSDSTNISLPEIITEQIERMTEDSDEETDFSELLESYQFLLENPVNINSEHRIVLRNLRLINAFQYEQLEAYQKKFGDFLTLDELPLVDGFDDQTIAILTPIIRIAPAREQVKIVPKNVLKYGKHQFIVRAEQILQERDGYKSIDDSSLYAKPNSRYLGSPQKIYGRYVFNYSNKIRVGLTVEKDPGEVFFKKNVNDSLRALLGNQLHSGFDFYSAHAYVSDIGILKAAIVGDYHLSFGQGLTMWTGMAVRKSIDGSSIMQYGHGIRPYTSANESYYMRGAAATFAFWKFNLSLFYSSKKADSNISAVDSVSNEVLAISTLQETGNHRTVNELLNKHTINQQVMGGHLRFIYRQLEIGYTIHQTKLDGTLDPDLKLYNQFDFKGKELFNQGIDFRAIFSKVILYGEGALSENGGWGLISGINIQPVGYANIAISYRNYQKNYQNFFSNAFAEGSNCQNEEGIYIGFNVSLSAKWKFTGYADHFRSDWLRYRANAPSYGYDYLAQLNYQINRKADFYIRFRAKDKMINSSDAFVFQNYLIRTKKETYRLHFNYSISNSFALKNRVELVNYRKELSGKSSGFVIYQDVVYRPEGKPYQLSFRYTLFDTDDYDSRIYTYESDVLYAFSVPTLYNKGIRIYLLGKVKLFDKVDLEVKIGNTWYSNQTEIGSGLDLIEGRSRTDAKIQLRWKL